ncbi:(2Fe-2S)-binding protein [Intrasporangium calvum]|uniref:(2Fe-2S)-binding protein n=1 Tax=Intrasporangium calvum TaxID=53358 RepID=A0ABT5GFS8_9MICO|nr:(2Fe-2S)-binding protein [Intrasporangium calvum]MDC5696670.1 (2Fe-2S)-binding protein [Intrasporangium calvum]
MIVCHCAVVTDRDLAGAYSGGATTLAKACQSTGAGRQCGSCVPSVRRLLCEPATSHSSRPEASR